MYTHRDAAASRVSVLEKETRDLRDKMEVSTSLRRLVPACVCVCVCVCLRVYVCGMCVDDCA